ncbi:TetR/AcrR family transcriptional regulator [Paenibacillus sp. BSR1-1]|uniref:TetR/AcrR family transcriptional regulator n=1 Tax=Paenibacillus sp. BSR1-1 TaxID=3020845 RepID=UPI0025B27D3F|nr:TetR/AcrR family transcriptional regulator [Paenibacillus sp. BSR1-1]MDN3020142.1 TetR/AcrR family transcriptional regulator [Paenibacillus sp. BSR1-1]
MSDKAADRRVIRTKRMIRDALTELMEEKGFEGITVRDLTEKASINRGTFYLHYRDKYDLLEQSEEEIISGIRQLVNNIKPKEAVSFTSQDEPFPIILKLFEYFQENASFMKVILGPKGDAAFQGKMKELIKKTFFQKIAEDLKIEEMLVPADYLISYVSSAHLGVIQHWLQSGMEKSPREMTLILTKMTLYGPGHVAGLKK